jgi:hypothetical protein
MKTPRRIIAALSLLAVCSATPALAVSAGIQTNLTGSSVWGLDWNYGNALAVNAIPLPVSPDGSTTKTFELLFQASLGNLNNSQGQAIAGTGLNSAYEITTVMGFAETGSTSAAGGNAVASFNFDPTSSLPNFVRMYIGPVNANPLAGTGYTDGKLFLSGHVVGNQAPGVFSTHGSVGALDQFGAQNWGTTANPVKTVIGNGASDVIVQVDAINQEQTVILDPSIISTLLDLTMFFDSSNVDPFRQTNPSQQFFDGTGFHTTDIGPISGTTINGITGPDFIFQSDANASFDRTPSGVPEPSTFVMAGLGLLMACGFLRRRRTN